MQTRNPIVLATVQVFATLAIALVGAAAMASEATQLDVPASTLTRAEVKAERAASQGQSTVVQLGEATVFIDRITQPASRAAVRAEAMRAMRERRHDTQYTGA